MIRNTSTAVRGTLRAAVFTSAVSVGFLGMAGVFSACNGTPGERENTPEHAAVLRVEDGDGRLSGGEEFVIGEWRSGTRPTNGASQSYADFRGQDGGPTLDLSLSGVGAAGTYACDGSGAASLHLSVDVNNAYRPDAGACRIIVDRVVNGLAEGRYAATLRHEGNSGDVMKVSGSFRASSGPEIAVAKAPKIGVQ